MKRPDALKYATRLQMHITGASLPSNLSYPALVEPAVLHALQSWISETEDSRTLWIVGPHENSAESSDRDMEGLQVQEAEVVEGRSRLRKLD